MAPVLKTARVTLRPLALSDQNLMADTIMADHAVMQWLPCSDLVATQEGQQAVAWGFINDFISPWATHGFGIWAVCSGEGFPCPPGRFIGYCGFLPGQVQGQGPELAYALGRQMWGRGLVSEAVDAGLGWLFLRRGISCAHAVTDRDNLASRRVMEKAGMTHTKNVDLYQSVAKGNGLLPLYSVSREGYFRKR